MTGTRWTTWSPRACRSTSRQGRRRAVPVRRRGCLLDRYDADRLQGRRPVNALRRLGERRSHRRLDLCRLRARYEGGPEVHSDGEIWAQTLWDFRDRFGSKAVADRWSPGQWSWRRTTRRSSTCATRSCWQIGSAYAGSHNAGIWQVFAHRGMGYFAGAVNGDDTEPVADFDVPPPAGAPTGTISGTVTDAATGDPVQDVTVTLVFQGAPSGGATVGLHGRKWHVQHRPGSVPRLPEAGLRWWWLRAGRAGGHRQR